jgi:ATP-binding protein involved in chromosome partitioning
MSGFICPHCGEKTPIFGEGGGKRTAEEYGVPFLGEVPIEPRVREGGDSGNPIVAAHPDSETAAAFTHLAEAVAVQLARDAAVKPRKPMIKLMQAR